MCLQCSCCVCYKQQTNCCARFECRVSAVAVANFANAQFDKDKVAPNEPKQMLSITICNNIPRSTSIKTISQLITLSESVRVCLCVCANVHYAKIYALRKPYASLPLATAWLCFCSFLSLSFSLRIFSFFVFFVCLCGVSPLFSCSFFFGIA